MPFSMPGGSEWLIILLIVLIFFGAGKLPDVFKSLGKGIRAFKDASSGTDEEAGGEAPKKQLTTKVSAEKGAKKAGAELDKELDEA
jgi:sec-independent protein translocase protein TatA